MAKQFLSGEQARTLVSAIATRLGEVASTAETAKSDASGAVTTATEAKTAADSAVETATEAKNAAITAQDSATAKAAEAKPAAKRACKKVTMELQYGDKCIDIASLEGKAVDAWAEATGNAKTAAKAINLYVKPEENTLYYVIEGETGMVEL